jgi:tetratricopeptide (TPR) repeat protein
MRPHAFVAMPFGTKTAADGTRIDFNRVYGELIRPALEAAGLEPFRADEELRAGEIRADMFQELIAADLVVVDLTTDNPNVWYELGVRHGLRARGVVLVYGSRSPAAFDVYTDRKLRYELKDGAPDPDTVQTDRERLRAMARATMESWHGRKSSPVYQLMPNLREPDWTSQRVGGVVEFWDRHDAWERRIELARRAGRIGDLLVLADEGPVAAFRAHAWCVAGEALRKAGRYDFALEQLERVLEIDPSNLKARQEKGMCLQRLAAADVHGYTLDAAHAHYRAVLADHPRDAETWALLGRVDKDAWIAAWRRPGAAPEEMRAEAAYEAALLRGAIDSYQQGFRSNPAHYYSGINALTLIHLHVHLEGSGRYQRELASMPGAVRFAAESESDPRAVFWAQATLADLEVLSGTPQSATAAYQEAVAESARDWFGLSSCLDQLRLAAELAFRPEHVAAGIRVLERALARLERPQPQWQPRKVVLFSGHRIDAPGRDTPRFPPQKADAAARRIDAELDRLGVGADDLALAQAAAGGDILFLEACRRRGLRCEILLPFPEPEFVERSILGSAQGDEWRARFYALKDGLAPSAVRIMPAELGPTPRNVDPYERCNLWLLCTALAHGTDKLHFICLWDGAEGDGPGGTAHMASEARRRTGRVVWIDSRTL